MIKINVIGLQQELARFKQMSNTLKREVRAEIQSGAKNFVQRAKRATPKDLGRLAGSISYFPIAPLTYEVVAQNIYAPYVEFGTKSKAVIPPELQEYASQYKGGRGGDYYDFLNAILNWVKRKGIGFERLKETNEARKRVGQKRITKRDRLHDVAEAIAFSIIRHGIKPHPFFFIQIQPVRMELEQNIKAIVEKL